MGFDLAERPAPAAESRVRIAHERPGRLRARCALLGLPHLDIPHLTAQLRAIEGVRSVRINPDAACAVFAHDAAEGTRERILDALGALRRDTLRRRSAKAEAEDAPSILPLISRVALLVGYNMLPPALAKALTAVLIAPRVIGGAKSLLNDGVTVDLLDSLAVTVGALRGEFRTALATDLMMQTGEYLEERTMRHSGALLLDMLMPNPETAWVERDGHVVERPFSDLGVGDLVAAQTGSLAAVDGVVVRGMALVNEASITGESVPVGKQVGDRVIAGSLIEQGQLTIEAEKVGDETTTAQIARLIRDSLEQRSDTERLAQRHADRQVYMTLGLGALTLLATRDLRRLSAVFLVDYACPIKLSAPVAVRAAMSEAVGRGILIKGGPSIEKLADADTFVFDKTGTLTHGALTVTDVTSVSSRTWPKKRLLALAASMEEHSHHPIARAIVAEAEAKKAGHLDHGDVAFEVGHGLRAQIDGIEALIGSRHFLKEIEGVDFGAHDKKAEKLIEEGKMVLYVAVGGKLVGLIGLRDELRADARETVERLRALNVGSLVMLTGDSKSRARAFGDELGFDEVHAELRPDDKMRILKSLRKAGRKVAFIGDGVNDAPALAEADIGISMSKAADIAQAAADITLLDDRIGAVADARALTVQGMHIIGTNSTMAIGFNSALFLAASAGLLSPVASAMLHNGSTIALLMSAIYRAGLPPRALAAPRTEDAAAH